MSDLSWLNPTPHAIAVYASSPLSPVATQHSLPSGRYSLLGPDLYEAPFVKNLFWTRQKSSSWGWRSCGIDGTADSHSGAEPLVKPRSRSRCAEGAGLDERLRPADHETVSLSHVCHLVFACGGVNPRLEPIARVRPLVAQTYIRSGLPHTKLPHALLRGRRAPRRMGPFFTRGVFQPSPATVTHPPWIEVLLLRVYGAVSLYSTR